jgi:phosphoglycerate dehydrogenase-like enzyme
MNIFVDLEMPADALEILRAETAGHQLFFSKTPTASILVKAEPDPQLATADIAFGQPDPQAVASAPRLKWIHVSSSGYTRYDTPQFRALAAERRLAFTNSAGVYQEACAVHALSFMLAQARNLPAALSARVANATPVWNQLRGTSSTLRGETVLILGYGSIGRRLVELLQPFGMSFLAYRRTARGDENIPVVTGNQLTDALHRADHVINILPESAETKNFFDAARLAAIKPGAVFYNIGRGATVDQDALAGALRSGQLKSAWLDVTDPEPLPDRHPLYLLSNCHITPHLAGGQPREAETLVRHFVANFQRFVHHEPLLDRVM